MKIAIIGAGLSGLQAANTLHHLGHEIEVFEANETIGGHIQTVTIPFMSDDTPQEAIVDMGVFMFDPLLMHPYLNHLIQDQQFSLTQVPLNFIYHINSLHWTQVVPTTQIKQMAALFFKTLYQQLIREGFKSGVDCLRLLKDLLRFRQLLIEKNAKEPVDPVSVSDFIKNNRFSPLLVEQFILPQAHCWWGTTPDTVDQMSIQVFIDSLYKVAQTPQYTLTQGFVQIVNFLSAPITDKIKTNTSIKKIIRTPQAVQVNEQWFDAVILATPPSISLALLEPHETESIILNQYSTTTTTVYLHTDESYVDRQDPSTITLHQDKCAMSCTFWVGSLHPMKPKLFLTWGPNITPPPENKTLKVSSFLRTLPSVGSIMAGQKIHTLQGENRTWHCGAHVPHTAPHSLWADNTLISGLHVAQAIHKWRGEL